MWKNKKRMNIIVKRIFVFIFILMMVMSSVYAVHWVDVEDDWREFPKVSIDEDNIIVRKNYYTDGLEGVYCWQKCQHRYLTFDAYINVFYIDLKNQKTMFFRMFYKPSSKKAYRTLPYKWIETGDMRNPSYLKMTNNILRITVEKIKQGKVKVIWEPLFIRDLNIPQDLIPETWK